MEHGQLAELLLPYDSEILFVAMVCTHSILQIIHIMMKERGGA